MTKEEKNLQNAMTEGVIWKQLLLFFFPIVLGTFFQQLYNTADAIIVGKFVGKEALAAVGGTTGTLINLLVGFFVGLSSGASVIISQFFGARRPDDVSRAVHTTMALALASGAALTVLGIWSSRAVLVMMGTPEDVLGHAVTYINIYFLGMIPSLIYNIGSGILRAVGDSRRPLFFLISATMTNIVLDVVLVIGLNMGVAGAAAATVLSQVVSAVLVMMTLCRSPQVYRVQLKKIRFYGDMLVRIVRIGLPAGLQSAVFAISNIVIQSAINSLGKVVMAASSAACNIEVFAYDVMNSYNQACTTFVGQNYGAGQIRRCRKTLYLCLIEDAVSLGATVALVLLTGRFLLSIFNNDPQVIALGYDRLKIVFFAYIFSLLYEVMSGYLRGFGISLVPAALTALGVCGIRIAWIHFVFPQHPTLQTIMTSYPVSLSATALMIFIALLCYRPARKHAAMEREPAPAGK